MTREPFDKPIAEVVHSLRRANERYVDALRKDDIPTANRCFLSMTHDSDCLAATEEGRLALEDLTKDPSPHLRLRAAYRCLTWSPRLAVPVIGNLIADDLVDACAPMERINIHTSAVDTLLLFFGIESWRQNDLIEPLRAYGIELPYEEEEIWT